MLSLKDKLTEISIAKMPEFLIVLVFHLSTCLRSNYLEAPSKSVEVFRIHNELIQKITKQARSYLQKTDLAYPEHLFFDLLLDSLKREQVASDFTWAVEQSLTEVETLK